MHSLASLFGTSISALVDRFRSPLAVPMPVHLNDGRQVHVHARFNWPVWSSLSEAASTEVLESGRRTVDATVRPEPATADAGAAARVAEQVRSGINSLPRGQKNAGLAMGFTLAQVYRYVLLPMAYRIIVPPLTSEFLNIFKNSAVATTIGLIELSRQAQQLVDFTAVVPVCTGVVFQDIP